jgi:branched-chain amino acid aminotransferase
MEINIATPDKLQPKPQDVNSIKFGHCYSDHMLEVDWSTDAGWTRPVLSPLHNFQLHPGSKVLHYAIELFEGMKAYVSFWKGSVDLLNTFSVELTIGFVFSDQIKT